MVGQVERNKGTSDACDPTPIIRLNPLRSDVVAMRVEALMLDPHSRQAARARLLNHALSADKDHAKDNDSGDEAAKRRRRERILELLGKERELNAVLALFEAHITSDESVGNMDPTVISLLADPIVSLQGANAQASLPSPLSNAWRPSDPGLVLLSECTAPLLDMFVDFVWEKLSSTNAPPERGLPPYEAQDDERADETPWAAFKRASTDLRHPHTWYPLARAMPGGRRIFLHVGPTNRCDARISPI